MTTLTVREDFARNHVREVFVLKKELKNVTHHGNHRFVILRIGQIKINERR